MLELVKIIRQNIDKIIFYNNLDLNQVNYIIKHDTP